MEKVNSYALLGIPEPLAITLVLVTLALTFAPWMGGTVIGPVTVPKLSDSQTPILKWLGPVGLIILLLGFFKFWTGRTDEGFCPPNSLADKTILLNHSTEGKMAIKTQQVYARLKAAGANVTLYRKPLGEGSEKIYRTFYWIDKSPNPAILAQNCLTQIQVFDDSSPSNEVGKMTPTWSKYDAIIYLVDQ